jgi:hypothetical protein
VPCRREYIQIGSDVKLLTMYQGLLLLASHFSFTVKTKFRVEGFPSMMI